MDSWRNPKPRPPRPAPTLDLQATAQRIVQAFHNHGFLRTPGRKYAHTNRSTSVVEHLCDGPPGQQVWAQPDIDWYHVAVEPGELATPIGEIVHITTNEEYFGDADWSDNPDLPESRREQFAEIRNLDPAEIFTPSLDICLFSQPVELPSEFFPHRFRSWAVIAFSFEHRYSEETHQILDFEHPFFAELQSIFGCQPEWHVA